MRTISDVAYIEDGLDAHKLNLYLPDADIKGGVIWFYGGGLSSGKRTDYEFLAGNLTANGYALVLPSYRLMPEYAYPDFIYDAAASLKKAKELLGDVKLLVGGSSAGAYLSMMLCFAPEYLGSAGLDVNAVDAWLFNSAQPTNHFNILEHAGIDPKRIIVDESAPLWHVSDDKPDVPMLLLCADDDMPSRRTQNLLMYETLLRYGHSAEKTLFETIEGFKHCGYDGKTEENGGYYIENRIYKLMNMVGDDK